MKSKSLKIPRPDPAVELKEPRFLESAAKLYWARQHAHSLSVTWEIGVERHYAAAIGGKMNLSYDINKHLLMPPVFIEIPLFIGDCIRNLRSALDYLISELARDAKMSDSHTVFPFSENPSSLKASFNHPILGEQHRKGRKAGPLYDLSRQYPNLEKVILTDIQPYSAAHGAKPIGDLLWRIITSDNIDKHRLMTPSIQKATDTNVRFTNGGSITGSITIVGNAIAFPPDMKLDKDSDISLDLIFKEPARLTGKPVMTTLIDGCNMVGEVIKIFRREFPAT